jgi:hypothetical protein
MTHYFDPHPDHLAPFALRTAFPSSLAGRYSRDYYEACVTVGLAPLNGDPAFVPVIRDSAT